MLANGFNIPVEKNRYLVTTEPNGLIVNANFNFFKLDIRLIY